MRRFLLACFIFSALLFCCPYKAFAYYDKNISAEGGITLFSNIARGEVFDTAAKSGYKSSSAIIEASVIYNPQGSFYLVFNPYFSFDYNNFYEDKETSAYFNFTRAAAVYDNDLVFLEGGRFDFEKDTLRPFVYYGAYPQIDNKRPSSLDGARAKLQIGAFTADTFFARPSHETQTDFTAGGIAEYNFFGAFKPQAFLYHKKEEYLSLILYGAGIDIAAEDFLLSFTAAFNGGSRKQVYRTKTKDILLDNYALNFNAAFKTENNFGQTDFYLNVFYTPAREVNFTAISPNLDMGYIFGGMQICGVSVYDYYSQSGENELALNATALKFNFRPYFLREFSFSASAYGFNAPSLGKHFGNEIDLGVFYVKSNFKIGLILGLFFGGDINLDGNIRLAPQEGGDIKKIGLNFSYDLPF